MSTPPYSVLISVYAKEKVEYLTVAINSIINQTLPPNEIVIVKDGTLTLDLERLLNQFDLDHPGLFKFVSYEQNHGLGYALSKGVLACSNELIARMDTDDYSDLERMDIQIGEFAADEDLDMLGSQVYEFIDSVDDPISVSNLPLEWEDIIRYSKRRNPFRHTPMVFKRSKVIEAGNYDSRYLYFEDWDLWNRMLALGHKGRNLDVPLVSVRVSRDFFNRRGGISYLPYIWRFKREQLKRGYFSVWDFIASFVPHALVCLLPNGVRSFIYTNMLRSKVDD